jgi:hypothetical protein
MRVWIGTGSGAPRWAGRVECIQTGEKDKRFNDPEELLAYLRATLLEEAGMDEKVVPAPHDDAPAAPVDPRGPAP